MFGIGKKIEIKKLDINEGYRKYKANPDRIVILCADELLDYDKAHIAGSECLPLRLMDHMEEYYPDKDVVYYVYAINKAISERAYKKLVKQGYDVYDLESYLDYRELSEGLNVSRQRNKRRK